MDELKKKQLTSIAQIYTFLAMLSSLMMIVFALLMVNLNNKEADSPITGIMCCVGVTGALIIVSISGNKAVNVWHELQQLEQKEEDD